MRNLKVFWLFLFLNYAGFDTAAQSTSQDALTGSHTEALSQSHLEVHVKGNMSGQIELATLEVMSTTLPNNETSAEIVYKKSATSEESQLDEDILENPFNSGENVGYSSEDKSSDVYLQSASPLTYTDNSENDEEAAAKQLTDGFKSNDVINGFETSGNFVAINEEHGSETPATNRRAALSEKYNFMNDTNEKDVFSAADEGTSTEEMNSEENLFFATNEENDESLFELNDPTEENWFGINLEEEANTYSPSKSISKLEDIRRLLSQTTTEMPLDLSKDSTEISVIETKPETISTLDSKEVLTITPSPVYSEEINVSGEKIENSDSLSVSGLSESSTISVANLKYNSNEASEIEETDTVEVTIESDNDKTETNLMGDIENNSKTFATEPNEEQPINQGNREEHPIEDVENDKTILSLAILSPQNMEEITTTISTNKEGDTTEVYILENNEGLVTATGGNNLSVEETDKDTAIEDVSDSEESEKDGPKLYFDNLSTESPNQDISSENNEYSIETDTANANEVENISEHISDNITEASVVQKTFPTAIAAFADEDKQDDNSETNSDYTEEDSTEVLPTNIQTGSTVDKNTIEAGVTVQNIANFFTEEKMLNKNNKLPIECITVTAEQNCLTDIGERTTVGYTEYNLFTQKYEVVPEDINTEENGRSEDSNEDEEKSKSEKLAADIIDKSDNDSEDVNDMEDQSTVDYFKTDDRIDKETENGDTDFNTDFLDYLYTTENVLTSTEYKYDGFITEPSSAVAHDLYETTEMKSLTSKTNNLETSDLIKRYYDSIIGKNNLEMVKVKKTKDIVIPVFEYSEDFDVVEPESFFNDLSDAKKISPIQTYNIITENQSKHDINTKISNVDGDLSKIATDATVIGADAINFNNAGDSTTIINASSDESDSGQSEDIEIRLKEGATESEVTLEPTTEVNAEKVIPSEESDSEESQEYVTENKNTSIPGEFPSVPSEMSSIEMNRETTITEIVALEEVTESNITLEPTTEVDSDKTIMSAESDSVESEEYVTEENHAKIPEKLPPIPSEMPSTEIDRVTLDTETAPMKEVTESNITLESTTEVDSDKTILSEELDSVQKEDTETAPKEEVTESADSDSVESEEYVTEENHAEISKKLPQIPSKISSPEIDRVTLDTETAPTEEVTESNITLESTTEVDSAKTILPEESDSVQKEDTETAPKEKVTESADSDYVESEEYVTEENRTQIHEKLPPIPSEMPSTEINRVILDTETAPLVEVTESNITLESTTEVDSDKTIPSEESDSVENEDTETAPKEQVAERAESDSVESEEYVTEENREGIPEKFTRIPSEMSSTEIYRVTLVTETAPRDEVTESEITLDPTTEVDSDKIILSEKSDSIESAGYFIEDKYGVIIEEFPLVPLETSSTEADRAAVLLETASKEEVRASEISLEPTTAVNLYKVISSQKSDSSESEKYVTDKIYAEDPKELSSKGSLPHIFPSTNLTEEVPTKAIYEDSFTSNTFLSGTETYITDIAVVGTETASKEEEIESAVILAPTTEVNSDEIIKSEKSGSVESEEYATDVNYEGIPKGFPSNENVSDISTLINAMEIVYMEDSEIDENSFKPDISPPEIIISYVETNRTIVDPKTISKEEEIEKVTAAIKDKFIPATENISEVLESSEELDLSTNNFNLSEVSSPKNKNVSFSFYEESSDPLSEISQNVTHTEAEGTIGNGTLGDILNYIYQQILTSINTSNRTENTTGLLQDEDYAGINNSDESVTLNNTPDVLHMDSNEDEDIYSNESTVEEVNEENIINLFFENENEDENDDDDISINRSEEIYREDSDMTTEDLSDEVISSEEYVPFILGKFLENDVNMSIKIVAEGTTIYVPPYAYLVEDLDNLILNVTWATSNKILNNSLSLTLTQISKYYVINGAQLNIILDNEMLIWKKNVVILPEKTGNSGEYGCVIELEDGVEVSISNIDFLSKSSAKENENNSDVRSSTSEMKGNRMYHIEIAVGCVVIALMLGSTIYFAIIKARKRTLKIKNIAAQHVAA